MQLIWLGVAIVFGIAELLTPSLTLIWFSLGAVALIFLSMVIENLFIQILIFAIISFTLLFIATKYFVKKDSSYKYNTNLQAVLNAKGYVKEDILPNKTGLVIVDREEWTAISFDNEKIDKGSKVEVLKIEGVKLVVKKSEFATEKAEI
ncbi:NfeD family protein [Clostridioides mangenotii]|uniref:NfeD family protein n=1 Tax=Metaclostridioides mangenotii TaxID=1540 RepID=UPI00214A67EB|nr:NfeD family protein [Clostridioides mangenotii]MCR1955350.1 NfeD family protein [Clostridioides mangenotii]